MKPAVSRLGSGIGATATTVRFHELALGAKSHVNLPRRPSLPCRRSANVVILRCIARRAAYLPYTQAHNIFIEQGDMRDFYAALGVQFLKKRTRYRGVLTNVSL